jgi:hypothetical protein
MQIYSTDMAFELPEAFDKWQQNGASDTKSSVAFDISLDYITLGLIYSEPTISPTAFAPFDDLEPFQVIAPAINTTFSDVYNILSTSYHNTTSRPASFLRIERNLPLILLQYYTDGGEEARSTRPICNDNARSYCTLRSLSVL